MIFDVLLLIILAGAFFIGMQRGLLRTIWGLAALIVSIILTSILHPFAIEAFKKTSIATGINDYVYEKVASGAIEIDSSEIYTLSENFSQDITLEMSEENIDAITQAIVDPAINIAGAVLLFLLIRVVLAIIYNIIKIVFSLPVLKQTNKIAGGFIQAFIALAAVYTVLAIVAVYGTDMLNSSFICKAMYENNILISIVART